MIKKIRSIKNEERRQGKSELRVQRLTEPVIIVIDVQQNSECFQQALHHEEKPLLRLMLMRFLLRTGCALGGAWTATTGAPRLRGSDVSRKPVLYCFPKQTYCACESYGVRHPVPYDHLYRGAACFVPSQDCFAGLCLRPASVTHDVMVVGTLFVRHTRPGCASCFFSREPHLCVSNAESDQTETTHPEVEYRNATEIRLARCLFQDTVGQPGQQDVVDDCFATIVSIWHGHELQCTHVYTKFEGHRWGNVTDATSWKCCVACDIDFVGEGGGRGLHVFASSKVHLGSDRK